MSKISKEQIEAWKKEHGEVKEIQVKVSEKDVAIGYLKKPSRDHKAVSLSMVSQYKLLEAGEYLMTNLWLGGDERLNTPGDIADSAAVIACGITEYHEGGLGKS